MTAVFLELFFWQGRSPPPTPPSQMIPRTIGQIELICFLQMGQIQGSNLLSSPGCKASSAMPRTFWPFFSQHISFITTSACYPSMRTGFQDAICLLHLIHPWLFRTQGSRRDVGARVAIAHSGLLHQPSGGREGRAEYRLRPFSLSPKEAFSPASDPGHDHYNTNLKATQGSMVVWLSPEHPSPSPLPICLWRDHPVPSLLTAALLLMLLHLNF